MYVNQSNHLMVFFIHNSPTTSKKIWLFRLKESHKEKEMVLNDEINVFDSLFNLTMFGADVGSDTETIADAMAAVVKNKHDRIVFAQKYRNLKAYAEAKDKGRVIRAKIREHKQRIKHLAKLKAARKNIVHLQ